MFPGSDPYVIADLINHFSAFPEDLEMLSQGQRMLRDVDAYFWGRWASQAR